MQRGNPRNRILDYWVGTPLRYLQATARQLHAPAAYVERVLPAPESQP